MTSAINVYDIVKIPSVTFRIPSNYRGEFPVFGEIVCDWDEALPS